jgi:allantoin racemase
MSEKQGPIAIVLAQYPDEERARREQAMRDAAPHGQDVMFVEIQTSVYVKGLTNYHRSLAAPLVARAAVEAEKAGASAVVPYGTLDLGIEEARHVVDIPVLGPGRSGAHMAANIARRISIVCYDQPHVVMFRKLLPSWGFSDEITSIRPVNISVTEMASNVGNLRKKFIELGKAAVEEEGAEVILPLGMSMVPVLISAQELAEEIGVPVVDPIAAALYMASCLSATGVKNSRVAYPRVEI